jgi:hypothetical protein
MRLTLPPHPHPPDLTDLGGYHPISGGSFPAKGVRGNSAKSRPCGLIWEGGESREAVCNPPYVREGKNLIDPLSYTERLQTPSLLSLHSQT